MCVSAARCDLCHTIYIRTDSLLRPDLYIRILHLCCAGNILVIVRRLWRGDKNNRYCHWIFFINRISAGNICADDQQFHVYSIWGQRRLQRIFYQYCDRRRSRCSIVGIIHEGDRQKEIIGW